MIFSNLKNSFVSAAASLLPSSVPLQPRWPNRSKTSFWSTAPGSTARAGGPFTTSFSRMDST